MDLSKVITIEDSQMSLEVKYREALPNIAYSNNKQTIAIYPQCVEYLDDDGILCKGGIFFMSEDKNRDYQKVETYKARAYLKYFVRKSIQT